MIAQTTPATRRRRLSPEVRHRVMASIKKTNTRPELVLRAALRRAGLFGYRLHLKGLIGCPDVVFTRWRVAVFVDGVFWHGHPDYFEFGTKGEYWDMKIANNIDRDVHVTKALRADGWVVLRYWDIDVLADADRLATHVATVLEQQGRRAA